MGIWIFHKRSSLQRLLIRSYPITLRLETPLWQWCQFYPYLTPAIRNFCYYCEDHTELPRAPQSLIFNPRYLNTEHPMRVAWFIIAQSSYRHLFLDGKWRLAPMTSVHGHQHILPCLQYGTKSSGATPTQKKRRPRGLIRSHALVNCVRRASAL